ncbi:unnamed protein product [Rotaria sp. Silwood2]|nr:unnamed protein product [Rotaria sp. Silwood2]CAF2646014.1 unnamed protein product [Rotaria sp. Silwood2]CAF4001127.1 unnamed protein product [Rotaria sp. Silwood2]CAF4182365.1 unnamed protein product [Rotaria sp. Silwood2]
MEKLANITQTDINNGVLNRMLANAGIPDVQEYVKHFHQETEELLIEEFEHSDRNNAHNDEQIVSSTDIYGWITGLRPRLDDPIQPSLPKQQQKQQQLPADVQSWITGLRPRLDDSIQPSLPEEKQQQQLPADIQGWVNGLRPRLDDPIQPPLPKQQEPQKQQPTDLKSWMQGMIPNDMYSSTGNTAPEITTTSNDDATVTGNLGTWLNDWSKSLGEQPPPKSLDEWLVSLIPKDMHEPIGKANNSKARLNSYLNAAEKVLSEHGYDVSNEVTPPTNIQSKVGMLDNVRQMYFLWKTLDKNNDRKITVEDVQIMLQEMGLGFLSKYVGQTLFDMVDSNHDGTLQFRDFIALMSIIKQLISAVGSAKTNA